MRYKGTKRTSGIEVTRASMVSGKVRTKILNITEDQLRLWMMGTNIQEAMPHLSPDEREFLMTGITPDEWNEVFYSLGGGQRIMGSWEE